MANCGVVPPVGWRTRLQTGILRVVQGMTVGSCRVYVMHWASHCMGCNVIGLGCLEVQILAVHFATRLGFVVDGKSLNAAYRASAHHTGSGSIKSQGALTFQ